MKNVRKKQIFDIEKVGFGDEDVVKTEVLSPKDSKALKASQMSGIKTARKELPKMPEVSSTPLKKSLAPVSANRVSTSSQSPKQVLATDSNSQEDLKNESLIRATVSSDLPTRKFRPNVYISPVYGLRQSKTRTTTMSSVEKDQIELLVSDSQAQAGLVAVTPTQTREESVDQKISSHEQMSQKNVALNDASAQGEMVEVDEVELATHEEINHVIDPIIDELTVEVEEK